MSARSNAFSGFVTLPLLLTASCLLLLKYYATQQIAKDILEPHVHVSTYLNDTGLLVNAIKNTVRTTIMRG